MTQMVKLSSQRRLVLGLVLSGVGIASGCVSSVDPGVELADTIEQDQEYYASYQRATRGGDMIRDFGLEFRIHATYLYPEYKTQLLRRTKDLYLQNGTTFGEADSKSGFFITVFGSDRDSTDLNNTNHWTIMLGDGGSMQRPVLVKKINDKKRWGHFFETISPWSADYLVVFDTPAANPGDSKLVAKPHAKLTIAHAEGKVILDW
jgi:hypothetical protein